VHLNNIVVEEEQHDQAALVHEPALADEAPPLFNFQAMLAEQGVPYVTDSPLQAWTDSLLDSPTSSYSSQDTIMADAPQLQQINFFSFESGSLQDFLQNYGQD
jgi:hypothetical protein